VQYAGAAGGQRRGVVAEAGAAAAGFNADDFHGGIAEEGMKSTDGIRTTAHAGNHAIRQRASLLQDLRTRLAADDGLQFAHQVWIRMRAHR
jgi:hypothetical protein